MNKITYKIIRTLLACTLLVFFTRCDFIFPEEADDTSSEINTMNIENSKDEAKLLVNAAQNNLDVIELINVIQEVDVDNELRQIVLIIEDHQKAVFKEYDEVAKRNVISIPNYPIVRKKVYLKSEDVQIEDVLADISSKLNEQIITLDKLSDKTNNEDFKSLVEVANENLEISLNKTNILKEEILNP